MKLAACVYASGLLLATSSVESKENPLVSTSLQFCALAADGSMISAKNHDKTNVGDVLEFSYNEKDVVAYKYEVCAEYNGNSVQLDSASKTAGDGALPLKIGNNIFEVQVPPKSGLKSQKPCTIDDGIACEKIVGNLLMDVRYDLDKRSNGLRASRGLYGDNSNNNDACVDAIPLMLQNNQVVVTGSTANARYPHIGGHCGNYIGQAGAWYKLIGDGSIYSATITEANYLSHVAVFTGGDCDDLRCVTGKTTWRSYPGDTYYILATGYDGPGTHIGDFTLSVTSSGPDLTFPSPPNDRCVAATTMQIADNVASVSGTTNGAHHDGIQDCVLFYSGRRSDHNTDFPGPGVWYEVEGDGGRMFASFKGINASWRNPMVIFSGGCEAMTCTVGDGSFLEWPYHTVFWKSVKGEKYLIRVQGAFMDGSDFDLAVRTTPDNTECSSATMLSLGADNTVSVSGSPVMSSNLYYAIEGNGSTFTVKTCYDNQVFSVIPRIRPVCGSSKTIGQYVEDHYAPCGYFISVTWHAREGTIYIIDLTLHWNQVSTNPEFTIDIEATA